MEITIFAEKGVFGSSQINKKAKCLEGNEFFTYLCRTNIMIYNG